MPGHVDRRSEASPLGRQRSRDGFRQARCASYFVKVPKITGDERWQGVTETGRTTSREVGTGVPFFLIFLVLDP